MSAEDVAREHYQDRKSLSGSLSRLVRRIWSAIDPGDLDGAWARAVPGLTLGLVGAQLVAARLADAYVSDVLNEQDVDPDGDEIVPDAFAGVASDGRDLEGLLRNPITVVKMGIAGGATVDQAMAAGYANLDMLVRTQLADAGRAADQAALVARPAVTGYVRMLVGDSCSRCIILAGRAYRWNAGFLRHPSCDCIHVPAAEDSADDVRTDPMLAFRAMSDIEQDRVFTKAGAAAIRDGADMAKVVNARRGMQTATVYGRQVLATTEAAGRRVRLMPEAIYAEAAGDRDEAVRLLKVHGYVRRTAPQAARPLPVRPEPAVAPTVREIVARPTPPPPKPARAALSAEAAPYQLDLGGIEDLADRVENRLGESRRTSIWEGIQGDKRKIRWPDGLALFFKNYSVDVNKLGPVKARYTVDAEQLAGVLGQALGVNVPRVYRRDEYAIYTDWVSDAPQFKVEKRKDGFDTIERAYDSDDGIRIGLLDMLTGNIDRHSGNLLIGAKGDRITGIDQGMAWSGALDRLVEFGTAEFADNASVYMMGPAKRHFIQKGRTSGFGDNPLTAADIDWIRRRLNEVRPLFEHLGRGGFIDYSLAVLDLLAAHATGSRRIFGA